MLHVSEPQRRQRHVSARPLHHYAEFQHQQYRHHRQRRDVLHARRRQSAELRQRIGQPEPPDDGQLGDALYYQVPSNTAGTNFNGPNVNMRGLVYCPGANSMNFDGAAGNYLVIVSGSANLNGNTANVFASPPPGQSLTKTAVLGDDPPVPSCGSRRRDHRVRDRHAGADCAAARNHRGWPVYLHGHRRGARGHAAVHMPRKTPPRP